MKVVMVVNLVDNCWVYFSVPVEDIVEMFLKDLSVFGAVHGNFTFVIGEVFWVVFPWCTMKPL